MDFWIPVKLAALAYHCQTMTGFGHLQVELDPLSLPPLFNPLPKLGASSTATLFVFWDVVEHFGAGQSIPG